MKISTRIQKFMIVAFLLIGFGIIAGSNLVKAKTTIGQENQQEKEQAKQNVKKYNVTLDGVEYTLPVTMKEILSNGWTIKTPLYYESLTFGEETFTDYILVKENKAVTVRGINVNLITNNDYSNYLVYSMEGTPDVLTVQGITSEMSVDEMLKIMGTPHLMGGITENAIETYTSYKDDKEYTSYHFQEQSYINSLFYYIADSSVSFDYDAQGKLVESSIESVFLDTRSILDKQVITEKEYTEPTKVESKATSFTFELDSKYYQLPVPVSKLIENGWEFPEEYQDIYFNCENSSNYGDKEIVYMTKGKQRIRVQIENREQSPQKLENLVVTTLFIDGDTTANYKLPGKVRVGTKQATVLTLYKNEKRYKDRQGQFPFDKYWNYSSEKNYVFYEYYNLIPQVDGNKFHTYADMDYDGRLSIDIVNGKVISIEYKYTPDTKIDSIISKTKEKKVTLTSDQDAFDFFNYSSTSSVWEGIDGKSITFTPDGLVSAIDESEEWFTWADPEPCTFDYKDKSFTISFSGTSTTLKVKYKILSSERVIFYVDGERIEATTKYVELNTPDAKYNQTIYLGQKKRLSYSGIDGTVIFSKFKSDNTKVAKVSKTGIVTPVSTGTTIIKGVITKNGIDYSVTIKLNVKKPYVKFTTVSTTMKKGATQKIVAKAYGLKGSIKYSVNNKKVATINVKTGKLTAKKKGTVIVTAKCGSKVKKITIKIK
ncbi:Ig-like domain-containing protein [Anaerosporobacter sp.]